MGVALIFDGVIEALQTYGVTTALCVNPTKISDFRQGEITGRRQPKRLHLLSPNSGDGGKPPHVSFLRNISTEALRRAAASCAREMHCGSLCSPWKANATLWVSPSPNWCFAGASFGSATGRVKFANSQTKA